MAGYKSNTKKSSLFLYTSSEQPKNEIKKQTIPFVIAAKSIKYFGIYLTKEMQDVYWKPQNTVERNQRRPE